MTLELISHPLCPYVHRTSALLAEIDVPFTARFVDLKAKPEWFLALSPRGKVPVLVVDDVALFESAVILEYVAERFAPELVPEDPLARARQRMWIEISGDLIMGQYKIATAGSANDRAVAVAQSGETLARFQPLIEGAYVGGARPGLIDFAAGPALVRFEKLQAALGLDIYRELPAVAAWSRAIAGRRAFTTTLVEDFDRRFEEMIVRHSAAA